MLIHPANAVDFHVQQRQRFPNTIRAVLPFTSRGRNSQRDVRNNVFPTNPGAAEASFVLALIQASDDLIYL
jgi:hypothetical protein